MRAEKSRITSAYGRSVRGLRRSSIKNIDKAIRKANRERKKQRDSGTCSGVGSGIA